MKIPPPPGIWLRLFLTGWLGLALLRPAVAQSPPGNYTSGNLTFPRLPPPQYVAVDLGNGYIVDMNDNGEVLVDNVGGLGDNFTLWSGGNATALPTYDDDDNEYYWEFVANDGEVLGEFWNPDVGGLARWNSTTGVSIVTSYVLPDDADTWSWPVDLNYTRDGSIYFGVEYFVQEVLATDFFDNPIGPENAYYLKAEWPAGGGNLSQVGTTIFFAGNAIYETPDATISYPIATAPGDITLNQVFANTTYTTPSLTELDYVSNQYTNEDDELVTVYSCVYYNGTYLTLGGPPLPTLQLNDVTVPWNDFFADNDSPDLTRIIAGLNYPLILNYEDISLSGDDETLDYLSSGNFTEANLTANICSNTALYFYQINSLGFGLSSDGLPWLNGGDLLWTDTLPSWDLNMDGSANFTAMLPVANLSANTFYGLTNLAENSTSVAGYVYDADSGNVRAFALFPAALAVDMNRDGNISFDVDDQTTEDYPFTFWLNDDVDRPHTVDTFLGGGGYVIQDSIGPTEATANSWNADYTYDSINCTRDLEDFARLWINIGALQSAISSGNIYVGLKWVPPTGNTTFSGLALPAIKLYLAYGSGNAGYLTNSTIASDQITGNYDVAIEDVSGVALGPNYTIVEPPSSGTRDYDFVFPQSVFANLTSANSTIHLLFEGCQAGQGSLSLVLLYYNGTGYTKMGSGPSVCLDLEDIKNLYERWTVGQGTANITESAGNVTLPASTANLSTNLLPSGQSTAFGYDDDHPGLSVPGDADEDKYILFVHGWNMAPWERDAFAETMLKRLYWQGYKGKFGTYQWPTTYEPSSVTQYPRSFDDGEYVAFLSAAPLVALINPSTGSLASYSSSGNLYVMAHSHGNLVVGEALRMAGEAGGTDLVNTYVAAQAAIPGESYDPSMTSTAALPFVVTNISIPGYLTAPVSGNFGPNTADIFSSWIAPGNSTPAVSAMANYYNTNDWALNLWNTNEIIKPAEEPQNGTVPIIGNVSIWTLVASIPGVHTQLSGNSSVYTEAPYGYSGNVAANATSTGFFNTQYWTSNSTATGSNVSLFLDTSNPQGNLTALPTRYEIMSYDDESRSLPLGEISANISGFSHQNLQSLWPTDTFSPYSYKAHPWHSGEFRFDAASQYQYWHTLLGANGFDLLP